MAGLAGVDQLVEEPLDDGTVEGGGAVKEDAGASLDDDGALLISREVLCRLGLAIKGKSSPPTPLSIAMERGADKTHIPTPPLR